MADRHKNIMYDLDTGHATSPSSVFCAQTSIGILSLYFLPLHTTSCLCCPQQASPVTGNCRLPFLIQLHTCHVALSAGALLLPGAWDTRVIYSPTRDKSSETQVSFQMFYMKSLLFPFSRLLDILNKRSFQSHKTPFVIFLTADACRK